LALLYSGQLLEDGASISIVVPAGGALFATPPWQLVAADMRKIKLIGSGSYGAVYTGEYRGDQVALKFVQTHSASQKQAFLSEVDVLWRMVHPCIVRVIGAVVDDSESRIVLELMRGGDMQSYLARRKSPLTELTMEDPDAEWPRRIQWLTDVASAAAYLHSRRIAHRVRSHSAL
jgi:serine/threonine protein kinase